MLKNATNTAFTVSELLRENQRRGGLGVGGEGGGARRVKNRKSLYFLFQNTPYTSKFQNF